MGKLYGWSDTFLLPRMAHYGLSIAEIFVAIGLWTRFRRVSLWISAAIAISGLIVAMIARMDDCGCAGELFTLTWKQHAALCGALGFLAVLGLGLSSQHAPSHAPTQSR